MGKKDILWVVDFAADTEKLTLMWVGWNSHLIPRDYYNKENRYLLQNNQSVECETIKKSLKISLECGEQNIAVTYDLFIAKLALPIQVQKSLVPDCISALGLFHIEP